MFAYLLLSCIILYLFWLGWKIYETRYFRKCAAQFPGPSDFALILRLLRYSSDSRKNFHILMELSELSERFFKAYILDRFYLVLYSAPDVEKLLNSNVNLDKSMDYKLLIPWLGYGLLTSTGQKWKAHRKILTPTFHFKILEEFIEVFNRNGEILCNKLKAHVDGAPFDIYKHVNLAAFDNICETAMGIKMNVQLNEDSSYLRAVKDACLSIILRAFKRWLQIETVFRYSSLYTVQQKALKKLHDTTESVIKKRRQELSQKETGNVPVENFDDINQKRRLTFLDLMLESVDGSVLTDQEIREEVDTFMFEGHDTVSSGLGFALYSIAQYPLVQEKIMEEQKDIFGDSDRLPTFKDLQEMKYLEQVIKEAQRLYPSVPIIGREIQEEFVLDGGYVVPKGTQVNVLIYKLHRNPQVFPNPEQFNPDHFTPEAIQNRHPYAFVPFSAGPRNCIGQRFAMLEMKATLSKIVRRYRLFPSPYLEDELKLTPELVLISNNGIHIRIEERV